MDHPEFIIVGPSFYNLFRRLLYKQVYRSGGKGRGKRLKWVLR